MVIGTLAVDGWAVTFGTARRGLGGWSAPLPPAPLTNCVPAVLVTGPTVMQDSSFLP